MVKRSNFFILLCLALIGFGLVSMYSASSYEAKSNGLDQAYYLKRQAVFAALGIAAFVIIQLMPMKWMKALVIPLVLICLVLMLLTLFTSFGQTLQGARRWLKIGPLPQFQPSELVKFATILFLAWYFSLIKKDLVLRDYVITLSLVGAFALLILLQRDFSTSMIFLATSICMLILGGYSLKWISLFIIAMAVPLLLFVALKPFRILRIASFLFPDLDPNGINYQVSNAKAAIIRGGLFGQGLGNGIGKINRIPEAQSDFIFPCIIEETGFVGGLLIMLSFVVFAFLGFSASKKSLETNSFDSYLSYGFTFMIVFQAIVNMAVVTGLLPPTGIPLPFFSQGGTNLLVIIMESAFIYKVMRSTERQGEIEQ